MLILKNVVKEYHVADMKVEALRGVDMAFRKSEFVSILGPSGCGKTTLLNIIGGLDRYTSGDLSINGRSTKDFSDKDWDAYRNHSIGFVFQSYNLIPHQSVLSNVELALTLSGVPKAVRRRRAEDVLKRVGLGDQLHKKPNQMSGGQMQRVAIARALVNDPDILLADEPTGALDSETSVQIMEILKEIAGEKLVIMVTHNPELAAQYSSRIIRLLDGRVIDDSAPFDGQEEQKPAENDKALEAEKEENRVGRGEKANNKLSMSFLTACSLSLNNLMTKKARTFMTSFAGSIGIIGIALILALSSGVQLYISRVEEDTLSSYPLIIEQATVDVSSLLSSMISGAGDEVTHDMEHVYSNPMMGEMLNTMMSEISVNDLEAFRTYLESGETEIKDLVSDIKYGYTSPLNLYRGDTETLIQVNPSPVMDAIGMGNAMGDSSEMGSMSAMGTSGTDVFAEMLGNETLLNSQYDVIAGKMPTSYNEVVLIVNENNEISDYTLYSLGLKDVSELSDMMQSLMNGGELLETEQVQYSYDELLALTFKLVPETSYYEKQNGVWVDRREDAAFMRKCLEDAVEIKVVGILRPSEDSAANAISEGVGYTSALTEYLIQAVNDSEIVKEQKANPETDVLTGRPFGESSQTDEPFDMSTLSPEEQAYLSALSEEERAAVLEQYASQMKSESTYEENLALLGVADLDNPSSISIYPKDFEAKERISEIISTYNQSKLDAGEDSLVIQYTDYIGLMMSSVTTIINAISYILIAFVAISLVVSSIMIGIITYISVLERTKEIGILRSIGASKKDIARVFNAETLIVGFAAGAIGIGVTLLLIIPINMIIKAITDISGLAALPVGGAVILVLISMALTFIAGLIPSRIAARKDPVVALRTE